MKRLFTYGCSYTKWGYPTWADYIGVNFDEYYNRGKGGYCNTHCFDLMIQDCYTFKFNPETDVVLFGTTGVNRFTWFDGDLWHHHGDLDNWLDGGSKIKAKAFHQTMWNIHWACIRTGQAIINAKSLLSSLKIPHRIFEAVSWQHWLTNAEQINLNHYAQKKLRLAAHCLDPWPSIDTYVIPYKEGGYKERWYPSVNGNFTDGHPPSYIYYDYVKEFLSDFITETTDEFYRQTIDRFYFAYFPKYDDRWIGYHHFLEQNYPCVKRIIE